MNEITALFLGGPADKKLVRVACRNGVPEPYHRVATTTSHVTCGLGDMPVITEDSQHDVHVYTRYPRPPCRSFDGGVILQVYMHDAMYAQIIKQPEFDIVEYLIKEYWQRNG